MLQKFLLITFGCQMNLADGQRIKGILSSLGYSQTNNQEEADLILFNTCCVRDHAEERLFGRVASLRNLKEKKKHLIIGLCGCLVQEHQKKLLNKFPFVDLLFGPNDIENLPILLQQIENQKKAIGEFAEIGNFSGEQPDGIILERPFSAFVNIIRGCTNFCTYCIVPKVRGPEISRPIPEIVNFVKSLVPTGVKEITLLGQNVIAFGRDFGIDNAFALLLEELNNIDNLKWIRFLTSHPRDFSNSILERIARLDKVCKTFHLPLQAGSNRILKLMNRGYKREQYIDLIKTIRRFFPDATVTTDIICGFPSETEEEFEETLNLVDEIRFDSAFMYYFSPRQGTPAEKMSENLPIEVKKERLARLIALQHKISLEKSSLFPGQIFEVLVEGTSKQLKGQHVGKDRSGRSINFMGTPDLIGEFVKVKITQARQWTLSGILEKP
ncbi:MAG: tRNA (N6-isopentenyl adenosine(37)-C2)-methylthiotransferase MiaB [Candidatus Riflebacteria bacterium]|nr:tRNA (N6-isopentenyl adenosine(37)-C2)-methylthiotransferase MiaB [Candidatus Riflebacteria bacterium]